MSALDGERWVEEIGTHPLEVAIDIELSEIGGELEEMIEKAHCLCPDHVSHFRDVGWAILRSAFAAGLTKGQNPEFQELLREHGYDGRGRMRGHRAT